MFSLGKTTSILQLPVKSTFQSSSVILVIKTLKVKKDLLNENRL